MSSHGNERDHGGWPVGVSVMGRSIFGRLGEALGVMTLGRFALALAASRLILLALLFFVSGGQELSNDTRMHIAFIGSPLAVMSYQYPGYEQYPPFLPMLEAAIGYPLHFIFPNFITVRLVMIVFDVIAGGLFFLLLEKLGLEGLRKGLCLAGYLILPMGWITSVVMAQDDFIGAAAVLAPIILLLSGQLAVAFFLCGMGVLTAKLFLMLELATLLAFVPRKRLFSCAAAAFVPIALVYGALTIHRIVHGFPLPLLGFHPNPYFGTNFWMLLHAYGGVNLAKYGAYSGALALAAAMIPAYIILRKGIPLTDRMSVPLGVCASIMLFFSFFYHVNPQYFMLIFPLVIATARNVEDALYCLLLSVIPWVGKLFQLATFRVGVEENAGKVVVLDAYARFIHFSPERWLAGAQVAFSLLTIFLSVRWCVRLARSPASLSPLNEARTDIFARTNQS